MLVGYNLQDNPRSPISELITWANTSQSRILSLDLPSGLDVTNGTVHTPCIKAADTLAR
jgi:NAD(P)H-hydrate epimerase